MPLLLVAAGMWASPSTAGVAEVAVGSAPRPYSVSGEGGTVTPVPETTWGERLADREVAVDGAAEPTGIWSDGETLWVVPDGEGSGAHAYELATGVRQSERDLQFGQDVPAAALWSDGRTLWASARAAGRVRAFRLLDGNRRSHGDLAAALTSADNAAPAGVWSDGVTLYVVDHAAAHLHAYYTDGTRQPEREFSLLTGDVADGSPWGLWSDGEVVLTSWLGNGTLRAYRLADGQRLPAYDIDVGTSGNADPRDLWSDGETLWVADGTARKLYAYAVPGLSTPPAPLPRAQGPGLGNLGYAETEVFEAVSWIDQGNGVPVNTTSGRRYGTNVGAMVNGYFVTLFAPDSGRASGGFLVYDVSDPRHLRRVARFFDPKFTTNAFREAHSLGIARIDGATYVATQARDGVEFWDFSDVDDIRRVSRLSLPGIRGGDYTGVWQLTWQAPVVYVAVAGKGLFIVDAGDPSVPFVAARTAGPNPVPPSELGGSRVGPVFAMGNHLVLSGMDTTGGWASLDISDPVNPVLMDKVADGSYFYSICFDGRRVYANGLTIYDLSDPAAFVRVSAKGTRRREEYCATQDGFVFQGGGLDFEKTDVSDGDNHRTVGRGSLLRAGQNGHVTPLGNVVFVGDDKGHGSGFIPHAAAPDTTPPAVLAVSPRDGATGQAVTSRIGVAFSDAVLLESANADTLRLVAEDGAVVEGVYSVQSGIVNFAPAQGLRAGARYTIDVPAGGVRDSAGNALAEAFQATFETAAAADGRLDGVAPETLEAGVVGAEEVFTALAADGATYVWKFGDGTVSAASAERTATHTYAAPGHYTVVLEVTAGGTTRYHSFVKTIAYPAAAVAPTASSPIAGGGGRVFNVNPDNGTVTAIHVTSMQRLWERRVGRKPRSLALDRAGRVWVAVQGDDRLVALDASGEQVARIDLGHGRGPFGIAFVPGTDTALVTVPASGEVVKIDAASATVLARARVNAEPRGIAVTGDGHAYVTRFRSTTAGRVTQLRTDTLAAAAEIALAVDAATVDAEDRARGRPNYLTQVVVSPDGRTAWVPSKQDNVLRGESRDGQALTHDTTVRAVVSRIDLEAGGERAGSRLDFDDREGAHAVAFSPRGDYAFVALRGSNEVSILDAYTGDARGVLVGGSGTAPTGVWIDAAQQWAFVYHYTSRSVAVYDIADVLASVSFEPPLIAELRTVGHEDLDGETLRGLRLFYDAADERMSADGYLSCASCHLDGGEDGAVWDFTDRGEGLRNTIALNGREGLRHGNVHWSANFDEIQDFENDMRAAFGGRGFLSDADYARTAEPLGAAKAGLDSDLDALARYVSSLKDFGRSPHRDAAGRLSAAALEGRLLFARSGCRTCHSGADFTDGRRHDVGTAAAGDSIAPGGVDTPTLLDVWRTAPYFHDGSAATLEAVLASGHGGGDVLEAAERAALAAYLRSLERGVEERVRVVQVPLDERYAHRCWEAVAASGEYVMRLVCDGGLSQQWLFDEQGRLRPVEDDSLCVTGAPTENNRLRLYRCAGGQWQRWSVADGAIRSAANLDFAVYGPQTPLPRVSLVTSQPREQRWYVAYESTRPHVSSDTGLSVLSVSGQRLAVDSAAFDHEVAVAEGVMDVSVKATPAHPAASVSIRSAAGALVEGPVAFPDGEDTVEIEVAVVAQDGQALDVHRISVRRSGPPGTPRDLAVEPGNGQVELSWSPPAGENETPVDRYEYRVGDGPWATVEGKADARSVIVGELANGTTHELSVRAVNGAGPGPEAGVSVTLGPSDASLRALVLSGVAIGTFDSETTEYHGAVAHRVVVTTVTATPSEAGARVTIEPADADVERGGHQVALAAGDTAIAVTVTAGADAATRTYTVTVTRAVAPLTGRFESLPDAHRGAGTELMLRLGFSEPVATDAATLRDAALEVAGGAVLDVDGGGALWDVVVTPDSAAELTVLLPAASDCASSGAVCTDDGRPLSADVRATVPGPVVAVVSIGAVSDTVPEGTAAGFRVVRAASTAEPLEVAVRVAESGSMVSGAVPTVVTVPAGERAALLSVATENDGVSEGDGTVTATLLSGAGYVLGDPVSATVTVLDDDIPEYRLAIEPVELDEGGSATVTVSTAGTVTRLGDRELELAVRWLRESDYRLEPARVVLGPEPSASVAATLTALDDGQWEPRERGLLTLLEDGVERARTEFAIRDELLYVSGVPQVSATLTAPELEGGGAVEYQWLRNGEAIPGATGSSHVLTGSDEGAELSVRVTRAGVTRLSEATVPIWGVPGNPPVRADEEELLGTLLTVGFTRAYPIRLGGYGRVSRASFGSLSADDAVVRRGVGGADGGAGERVGRVLGGSAAGDAVGGGSVGVLGRPPDRSAGAVGVVGAGGAVGADAAGACVVPALRSCGVGGGARGAVDPA